MSGLVELQTASVGVSSSGPAILLLGIALLIGAPVLYWLLPKLDNVVESRLFGGRQRPGRRLRVVGGPVLVAVLGAICVISGIVKLTS